MVLWVIGNHIAEWSHSSSPIQAIPWIKLPVSLPDNSIVVLGSNWLQLQRVCTSQEGNVYFAMQYQINSAICKIYEKKESAKALKIWARRQILSQFNFWQIWARGLGWKKSFSSWQISKVSTFLQLEIVSLFAEVRNVATLYLELYYNYLRESQLGQFMLASNKDPYPNPCPEHQEFPSRLFHSRAAQCCLNWNCWPIPRPSKTQVQIITVSDVNTVLFLVCKIPI